MSQHDTGRHAAPESPPKGFILGKRRQAWRQRPESSKAPVFAQQPDPDKSVELVPGSLLGYFRFGVAIEVTYGSSQNLWLKSSVHPGPCESFADFAALRYQGMGQIDWRNGRTCFNYGGPEMDPGFMRLHSPDEAAVAYRSLVLYWHFTRGWPIAPTDAVVVNPHPEWLDGDTIPVWMR